VASRIHHIGKEANHLEDVEAGLIGDLAEVLTEYVDPDEDPIRTIVLPVLDGLSDREVGRRMEVDHKTVGGIRDGARPQTRNAKKLWKVALELAEGKPPEERSPAESALIAEAWAVGR
jgi:hypothetical protein